MACLHAQIRIVTILRHALRRRVDHEEFDYRL